ncbi:MAG: sensor histidine kinase [Chitinophagaceae bacterium]
MEFDNDRLIKPTHKTELYCWLLFVLISPAIAGLSVFPYQYKNWELLLFLSILVAPLYILFARVIVPRFLFTHRYRLFALLTAAFLFVMLAEIWLLYAIIFAINQGRLGPYFTFNNAAIARETAWWLILTSLSVAIAYFKKRIDEADVIADLQKENNYYKLRYFRTQLNPHFLFNTLNSIYSLSLNHAAKTPEVVVRLADIMRFLIYECNEEKIPLTKEIEFINNYIEIEKIRYDADIQFTVKGDPEHVMIEPFLFISFIENGFKHAIDNSFAKPFIYITLKIDDQQLSLNVINNTNLELEAQAKKIKGKGLENSKSVLELLYPDAYALDIIQTEKKERKESKLRLKNAQERLESLYPDAHTLDVILNNNTFTVSLILQNRFA